LGDDWGHWLRGRDCQQKDKTLPTPGEKIKLILDKTNDDKECRAGTPLKSKPTYPIQRPELNYLALSNLLAGK